MDLSVLIPARNEQFLARTVADVLEHSKAQTEVIVVLDGAWPTEPVPQHPRVMVVYLPQAIGQRAATNLAARLSEARYICKLDAHCAVADGWDVELIRAAEALGPDVTQIPAQKNLHVYNRVCPCGRVEYQGSLTAPCVSCEKTDWRMDIVWMPRGGTTTKCWTFTAEPRFQYGGTEHRSLEDGIGDVMTSLGACFFMARSRFWQLGGMDEAHGSWGSFGIEIACKSWLSGGRHVVNTNTWFAHFFRVGGIGFPYPISGSDQERARTHARDLWFTGAWPGQVKPLSWLVDKFWPIAGWTEDDRQALQVSKAPAILTRPRKGVVYYSDCRGDERILSAVRQQLEQVAPGPIVSVTLQSVALGRNVVLDAERGYLTMFRQILAGLEAIDADLVWFAEHDVLYDASHFQTVPDRPDVVLYNQHVYKVDAETGRALHYRCSQTSGLCAYRETLLAHYRKRVALVEQHGFTRRMGFEPGTHRRPERVDDLTSETWMSRVPNVDIRHRWTLTPSRWSREQFRDQRYTAGWTDADAVPGWGVTKGRFWEFLQEATSSTVQQAVA